jgi:type IV pilus assembly protein PilB
MPPNPYQSPELVQIIAREHGLDFVDLTQVAIPPSVVQLVPEAVARENSIVPLGEVDGMLKVAISNPQDYDTLDRLRFRLDRDARIALATRESIVQAIDRYYGRT